VLEKGLTKEQARTLWFKEVVPFVQAQRKAHAAGDPKNYYNKEANRYYKELIKGLEVFGNPDQGLISKGAGNAASYFTGFAPHIATYDVFELITKGMTQYGSFNFIKGMGSLVLKSKGFGAFGRMEENKALYFGTEFHDPNKGKFKKGAQWLVDHINPQYYSNNLLTNGAAEIGRAAGVDPAEAVRKIAFIKEIGNTPAYLRSGGAEAIWARYSTEAVKFYIDIHADLGRALIKKDPKAFTAAFGHVFTYHALLTAMAGAGASLPKGLDKVLNVITNSTDEDNFFTQMNEQFPIDLVSKATGVDAKKGLQLGAPAYGLAFSAATGIWHKALSAPYKAGEQINDGNYIEAAGIAAEGAQMLGSLFYRNLFLTKTAKNIFKLSTDYFADGYIDTEKPMELFTGKDSTANY